VSVPPDRGPSAGEVEALRAEVAELRATLAARAEAQQDMERTREALLSLLEDVRESNQRLERARREWERTFDAVTSPLIVHDGEGRILRANRAYARCAGLAVEDLNGRRYTETWPLPAEIERVVALDEGEREHTLSDGRVVVEYCYPGGGEGAEEFSVCLFDDVTRERRGEQRLRASLEATIGALAATVEVRDPYTAGHDHRVSDLAFAIAGELGLEAERRAGVRLGALVHDLGKIALPAEILAKPARLTAAEFELVKSHSQLGYEVLRGVDFPWPIAECVLLHHERLDGSGYPQGLTDAAIPLHARIIAVADVVEAMATHRPYRPALGIDAALAEVERGRGERYCERAVAACLALFRERGYRFPE